MFKDRWIQKFRKKKDVWILTTTKGTLYPCSAEQVLSHLLPTLAGIKGQHATVKVAPDDKIRLIVGARVIVTSIIRLFLL